MPAVVRFYQKHLMAPLPGFNTAGAAAAAAAGTIPDTPGVLTSPAAGHVPPVAAPPAAAAEADTQNLLPAVAGPPNSVQPSLATAGVTAPAGPGDRPYSSPSARRGWLELACQLWIRLITILTGTHTLTRYALCNAVDCTHYSSTIRSEALRVILCSCLHSHLVKSLLPHTCTVVQILFLLTSYTDRGLNEPEVRRLLCA